MRRVLLLFFIFASFGVSAQEEKPGFNLSKNWLLGGNGQLYIEKVGDQTGRLIFVVEPQTGYFFNQSWLVGLRTPLSFKSNEYEIGALPFVRFYFPVQGNIIPFVEANGGYNLRVIIGLDDEPNVNENSWVFGARGGGAFFLNDRASIDLFLFYTGESATFDGSDPLLKQFAGVGAGFVVYLD